MRAMVSLGLKVFHQLERLTLSTIFQRLRDHNTPCGECSCGSDTVDSAC